MFDHSTDHYNHTQSNLQQTQTIKQTTKHYHPYQLHQINSSAHLRHKPTLTKQIGKLYDNKQVSQHLTCCYTLFFPCLSVANAPLVYHARPRRNLDDPLTHHTGTLHNPETDKHLLVSNAYHDITSIVTMYHQYTTITTIDTQSQLTFTQKL